MGGESREPDPGAGRGLSVPAEGARLLEGAPIAAEIRRAVAEASRVPGRSRSGAVARGRDRRQRRSIDRLPRADPAGHARRSGIDARFVEIEGEATEASVVDADPGPQRGPGCRRGHRPDAAAADDPAARGHRRDRPGQGHRRDPSAQRRPAPLGYDGFLPATAHAAVEILRRSGIEIEGKRRGRRRPVERRRHAGSVPARPGARHGHGLPLADARPRGPLARRRDRRRRGGPPGPRHGRHAQARRGRRRRRHQRRRRQASSATSTSSRRGKVASAITPVPGGVGPVTNALLLSHLVRAAEAQAGPHATAVDARPPSPPPEESMTATDLPVRPRDRPVVTPAADRRGRRRPRDSRRRARAVRADEGQGDARRRSAASRPNGRAASTSS